MEWMRFVDGIRDDDDDDDDYGSGDGDISNAVWNCGI